MVEVLNERGIILYTHNDITGEEHQYYSNAHIKGYTGASNQSLLDITTIGELNPTASSVYASGIGNILVYDNYTTTFNVLFKSLQFRNARSDFMNNVFYNIQEIGIVNNVYSDDQTIYRKKCLPVHANYTENDYTDGIVLEITIELRGTWYWMEQGNSDNTVSYIKQGMTVLHMNSTNYDDLYNKVIFYNNNGGSIAMLRKKSLPINDKGIIYAQYGAFIGTDGSSFDMYKDAPKGGPIGKRSYGDLGPSRQADWAWGFFKDQEGGNSYGNIEKVKRFLYQNSTVHYQALNASGKDVTSSVDNIVIHYLDFI